MYNVVAGPATGVGFLGRAPRRSKTLPRGAWARPGRAIPLAGYVGAPPGSPRNLRPRLRPRLRLRLRTFGLGIENGGTPGNQTDARAAPGSYG